MSWHDTALETARIWAKRSKDTSSQVGCCILGPDHEIRSTGYNGMARGVDDRIPVRHERPEKYMWFEHAERNAIYNAARIGVPLQGCRLYSTMCPCCDCARAIIQVGIIHVIISNQSVPSRWFVSFSTGVKMMREAGITVSTLNGGLEHTVLNEI